MTLPIAVLISGSGTNLDAIIRAIEAKRLDARITVVISNNPDAYGLERAKAHCLPYQVIDHGDYASREAFDAVLAEAIRESGAKAVILAGFMRILSPSFISAFSGNVLNIHPAILPSFAGANAQRQQADFGVRLAGCTVHFVDEKMDNGPIVIQAVVPAYPDDNGDTLGQRILEYEHRIYPQAIQWLAQGRLKIQGRKVVVANAGKAKALPENGVLINPPLEEGF
ncbi:phosphoribosylglycinamide formyltransferase [Desulfoplanes formicivorans]|uniref:Phosphoribosylglycinamide formyltransferase n=1 Tax=Desulfoplanes formicivorans TaxID=1592317 RepID=A0A194AJU4_9BACT|nr:phosphoribosylglycinamide formyltransferase [Desulfoplanes formicivorans]GAU09588.1 phosphoribosylglycinamide formyltransferase [Desulfoplanes formicivorans]